MVCAQNGVTNEPATLRRFAHTYAITVMLPAQHLEPGVVVQGCHPVPGILDIGRYPSGTDEVTERVSADLRSAGFESVPRPDIMAWKYRKLRHQRRRRRRRRSCRTRPTSSSRSSAPRPRRCSPPPAYRWSATRRTSSAAATCSGVAPTSTGPTRWARASSARTAGTEVDFRAGEIVLLGRLHGVPTPANERVQLEAHRRMRDMPR